MKTQLNLKITMTGICLLIAVCLNTVQAENYTVKQYYKPNHPDWTVDGNGNKIDQPDEWIELSEPHPKIFPEWYDKQIVMQYRKETVPILCSSIIDGNQVCNIQLNWSDGEARPEEKTQRPENMGIETVIATNADETVSAANGLVLTSTKQYTLQFIPVDRRCTVKSLMDDEGMKIQRSSNKQHYERSRVFTVNYDTYYQGNDIKFIFASRCADFQLSVDAIKESIDPETGYKVYSIIGSTDAKIHLISTEYPGEEKYFNITGDTGSVKLKFGDNLLTYKVESEAKNETRTQNIIVRCIQDNYNFKVDLFSPIDSRVERNDTSYIVLASHSDGYVNVSVKAEDEENTTIKCVGDLSTPLKHDETRTFTWTCKALLTGNEQRKVFVIRRKSNTVTIEPDSTVHIEGNRLIVLGTELPEITLTDPKSSYTINKDKSSITVTSEDKTVQRTYDIHYFTFDPGVIIVRVCGEVVKRNGKTYTAYVSKNSEWENRIAVTSIDKELTVSKLTNVDKYVRSFRISKYGFVEELEVVILVSDMETGINTIDSQRPYTVIDVKTGRIIKDNVTAKEAVELIKKLRTVKVIQKK